MDAGLEPQTDADPPPDPELLATRYDVTQRVATITLNRPERLNAWTAQMNTEYRRLLRQATDDPSVRVIVVTGAGRGFCAGAESEDLAAHAERGAYDSGAPNDLATPGYGVRPEFDAELAYHFGIPKPIIAAINGPVAGIGFALACYCDLRFATDDAKFTTAHGKLGLPCAFGLAWLLPKLIGLTHANDLILSSRTFTSEEARSFGLVNDVLAPDNLVPHVAAYARDLATAVSPASMAASKLQVYQAFHSSAAESVRAAEALLSPMMSGPDYREGVAALREKRTPEFDDPAPVRPNRQATRTPKPTRTSPT
jgi:enoyl-CoA hydratase/carnithine racemase